MQVRNRQTCQSALILDVLAFQFQRYTHTHTHTHTHTQHNQAAYLCHRPELHTPGCNSATHHWARYEDSEWQESVAADSRAVHLAVAHCAEISKRRRHGDY